MVNWKLSPFLDIFGMKCMNLILERKMGKYSISYANTATHLRSCTNAKQGTPFDTICRICSLSAATEASAVSTSSCSKEDHRYPDFKCPWRVIEEHKFQHHLCLFESVLLSFVHTIWKFSRSTMPPKNACELEFLAVKPQGSTASASKKAIFAQLPPNTNVSQV